MKPEVRTVLATVVLSVTCGWGEDAPKPASSGDDTTITVGADSGDVRGNDSLAIQKAIDQILRKAPKGGGTVVIKAGTYTLYDSLHLRGSLTLKGEGAKTILKKAPQYVTSLAAPLGADAVDMEVKDIGPIKPGWGVTQFQPGTWAACVRSTVAVTDNRITLDRPRNSPPNSSGGNLSAGVKIQTSFPLVQILSVEGVNIEDLVLDGNLAENKDMDVEGCRNGGIYMFSAAGGRGKHVVRRCVVRDFAGDGISWQGPTDVTIEEVESTGHLGSGLHPGTGAARAVVRKCRLHHNSGNGIYICWDIRNARFEDNVIEYNQRCGISTGHGDADCLFLRNTFRGNKWEGVLFRNQQPLPNGCTFRENVFEDNSKGVKISANVVGTVFERNTFRDTRKEEKDRTQKVAIVSTVPIAFRDNSVEGEVHLPADSNPPK